MTADESIVSACGDGITCNALNDKTQTAVREGLLTVSELSSYFLYLSLRVPFFFSGGQNNNLSVCICIVCRNC